MGKVSSVSFDLWVKPLVAECFEDGNFVLSAGTTNAKSQAVDKRHFEHIERAIRDVAPIVDGVEIIDAVEKEKRAELNNNKDKTETKAATKKINSDLRFNPNQRFDNFITGRSNQIVCAAAEAVAKKPGRTVNPLFIYGGTGLGKTHLLNAIVNEILEKAPKTVIAFVSSENFTNDFVDTMRDSKHHPIATFREKYRAADILLVDDIQFIRDKPSTQEQFFHTFNDLVQNGKQVVLTSDRHPDEMPTLEERMRSRFKGGLIQDVATPDIEMWMALLQKKANDMEFHMPKSVCEYLAKHAYDKKLNVREMEGVLLTAKFSAQFDKRAELCTADCDNAIKETRDTTKYQTTAENIIAQVCKYFDITVDDITGKRRNREFVEPRMIAMYLIEKFLNLPLINIGHMIGGRDHTTVMHARNKIEGQIESDQRIKRIVGDISKMIDNK